MTVVLDKSRRSVRPVLRRKSRTGWRNLRSPLCCTSPNSHSTAPKATALSARPARTHRFRICVPIRSRTPKLYTHNHRKKSIIFFFFNLRSRLGTVFACVASRNIEYERSQWRSQNFCNRGRLNLTKNNQFSIRYYFQTHSSHNCILWFTDITVYSFRTVI